MNYSAEQLAAIEPMTRPLDEGGVGIACLTGNPGSGKAQPKDALVLTPKGFVPIGELRVGATIIGVDGKSHGVNGVYDRGVRQCYRVTMDDGRSTECCDEHLWTTRSRVEQQRGRPFSVKQLFAIRKTIRASDRDSHRIPVVSPVNFGRPGSRGVHLPLHPYLLGLLIGDGSLRKEGIRLSNPEADIRKRAASLLPPSDEFVKVDDLDLRIRRKKKQVHVAPDSLVSTRSLGLSGLHSYEKFIPKQYLYASIKARTDLLRGLLDSDGHVSISSSSSRKSTTIEFSTSSEKLANDVVFLVRSLGGRITWRVKQPTYTYLGKKRRGRLSYRMFVCFGNGIVPVSSRKHLARWKSDSRTISTIKSIHPSRKAHCVCISTSAPDGLYVTDDFIVTHNTTIATEIMTRLATQYGRSAVRALSPTGKAARRFTEVTGFQCHTIHKMVWSWEAKRGEGDSHDLENLRAVVVDEASMVDTYLAERLLALLPPTVERVLFVGDANQLPSVGPGCFLRDLMVCGKVPTWKLTKIWRQSEHSWIRVNADKINRGERPIAEPESEDYFEHICDSAEQVREVVRTLVAANPQAQVLVPMRRFGIGAQALNDLVRDTVNPAKGRPGWKAGEVEYHRGDRVIHKVNNYQLGVANGEVGVCTSLEKFQTSKGETDHMLVVDYGDRHVVYNRPTAAKELRLAYALTIHSSQGSEYEDVIAVVHSSAAYLLCRELFYTAVSRAKKRLWVVGDERGIQMAVKRVSSDQRVTMLVQRIQEACGV